MSGRWPRVENPGAFLGTLESYLEFRSHEGSERSHLDVGTETSALVSYSLTGAS